MTNKQWKSFCNYKNQLKSLIKDAENQPFYDELKKIQEKIINEGSRKYNLENSFVYNTAYDEITQNDEIRLIVVGDNPGWEEQLEKNKKYLVGQSGRIAEGYFNKKNQLHIQFRKNVIITNKTPVHTPKTIDIKKIKKEGSFYLWEYLNRIQTEMAKITAELHQNLIKNCDDDSFVPQLWMIGYSELKTKGVFELYRNTLKQEYTGENKKYWENVFVFQHFSMNRFTIDLNEFIKTNYPDNEDCLLGQYIYELGHIHKDEIFGKME